MNDSFSEHQGKMEYARAHRQYSMGLELCYQIHLFFSLYCIFWSKTLIFNQKYILMKIQKSKKKRKTESHICVCGGVFAD